MPNKVPHFVILLLLIFSTEVAAQLPESRILWNKEPLVWENFEGTPDPASSFDANTSSGLSYSWSLKKDFNGTHFVYKVESYFLPDGSWVKPGRESELLLAHEQLHFDITEVFARQLRQKMEDFNPESRGDIKQELQRIYKKIERERALLQEKFDRETRHGQDEAAQLRWRKQIDIALLGLKPFSA